MASARGRVVVLGTGGTIAGAAASATDNVGYAAAQRSVQSSSWRRSTARTWMKPSGNAC